MATSTTNMDKDVERRNQVTVGELPSDFLRVSASTRVQQEAADHQTAVILQQQMSGGFYPANAVGRLSITLVQARLSKNYGLTKMDPYCRIRVGHSVYETHTAHSGGKNPYWNKTILCYLPQGVNNFYLEVFDECAFTFDQRVAWCHVTIPDRVLQRGEVVDDQFMLSGQQGDEKEGTINIVMSYSTLPAMMFAPPVPARTMVIPGPTGLFPMTVTSPFYQVTQVVQTAPAVQYPRPQPQMPIISEDDLKQLQEMFPDMDKDVIKTVLENKLGNKDVAINALLQMAEAN